MFKEKLKKFSSIILWMGQLLLLCGSFFAFTATIKIFPWYEPLTMGPFFLIMYLIPSQILWGVIYLIRYRALSFRNIIKTIPIINECILLITFLSAAIDEGVFYPVCIFMSIVATALILFWIVILVNKEQRLKLIK